MEAAPACFGLQRNHHQGARRRVIKIYKIMEAAPTCFGLQRNHHQGARRRVIKT